LRAFSEGLNPFINWYADSTTTNVLGQGSLFATPSLVRDSSFWVGITYPTCVSARKQVRVVLAPQPAAPTTTGADRCAPDSVILTGRGPAGTLIYWYAGNNPADTVISDNDTLFLPNQAVSVTYYAASFNGTCLSATRVPTRVNINTPPAAPTITQVGLQLESSYQTGNQWYNASGIIAGANRVTYTPTDTGTYYVVYTDANGCTSRSAGFVFIGATIQDGAASRLQVYPNPSTGTFTLRGLTTSAEIKVYDALGLLVVTTSNSIIQLPNAAPGIYRVEVKQKGTVQNVMLLVE
jgi:hypothetical protein